MLSLFSHLLGNQASASARSHAPDAALSYSRAAVKQHLLQTERKEGDEWMRQTEQGVQVMGGEKVMQGGREGGGT